MLGVAAPSTTVYNGMAMKARLNTVHSNLDHSVKVAMEMMILMLPYWRAERAAMKIAVCTFYALAAWKRTAKHAVPA